MSEKWRTIPGFSRYQASDDGQVRSIGYNGRRSVVLRQQITGRQEYRTVMVHDDELGAQRRRPVHVLALLAHRGARPDGMVARHLDDDPSRNCIENLAWGTPSENTKDLVANGNHHNARKLTCPQGHEYDTANTYRCPSGKGGRQCRACRRSRSTKPTTEERHVTP